MLKLASARVGIFATILEKREKPQEAYGSRPRGLKLSSKASAIVRG
jgi:hypothetical protein